MMKSLIQYREFGPEMGLSSMKDSFDTSPYLGKNYVVQYLKMGRKTYAKAARAYDAFSGEAIHGEYVGMTDEEYSWNSVLIYYVEKYNLRLPKDFEEKAISILSSKQ